MSKITGKEYPLDSIFSKEFEFYIPGYQRPYAWTEEETGILFDDLYRFFLEEHNDNYFLGSIVLIKDDNIPHADVIDGQQRLTTLTIMLSVITSLLPDNAKASGKARLQEPGDILSGLKSRPRLHLRERDQDFFNLYIQEVQLDKLIALDADAMKSEPQRHIQANCKTLLERFNMYLSDEQDILKFTNFLLTRCYLVCVYTPSQESAFRVFSVMNSRGLDLLPIDIIKSNVLGCLPHAEMDAYTDLWENLENDCGREGFNEVFTHTRSIFAKERPRASLLDEFTEYVVKKNTPKALIDDVLSPYVDAYVKLKNSEYVASSCSGEVNDILYWLNKLSNYDWMPPAIKFLAEHSNEPTYVLWFVEKLERLAAYLLATSKDVNQRFDRYKWILAEMDSRPDHCLEHPLTTIELTNNEKRAFMRVLDGEIYTMQAQRRNYIIQRLDSFVSAGGAQYNTKIFTIEHVLPQTVNADSEWASLWPETEQRSYWLNRIANLVPLTRRVNSSAQNYDFATKKTAYFMNKGGTTSYALTTQVINYKVWSIDTCKARQSYLLDVFRTKWDLTIDVSADTIDPSEVIFHIASRGSDATGHAGNGKEFIVHAGSIITHDTLASLFENYGDLRKSLINNGTIANNVFMKDYQFDSSSAAAAVILGRAANGPREWSTLDGMEYSKVIGH